MKRFLFLMMMTGIALTIGTMSFAAIEPQAEQTAMQSSYQPQNDYGFVNISFDYVNVDVDFIDIDFAADIEFDRVYETQTLSYINIVLRAKSSENLDVGYIDQFRLCGGNSNFDNFSTHDVLLKGNIILITPC